MRPDSILSFIAIPILLSTACQGQGKRHNAADGPGIAVVELFTSEGCSSCPAADAVLSSIRDDYKQNVYVMEFHVDYWNYLGWEDVYSAKEFSQRQQRYVQQLRAGSSYTPQAVVNGQNELVGSNGQKLHDLIDNNLSRRPANTLKITATSEGPNVKIAYTASSTGSDALNIAIVQKNAETNVKRGENSGRKLKHINVVRELKTIFPDRATGSLVMPLPQNGSRSDYSVIAWTQDKVTGAVSGATATSLN